MVCRALGALLAVVIGGKGAHAQFNLGGGVLSPTCDFASFQSRSEQVDIACCQGKGSNVCTTGTPSQCDLECALVYLSFFEDCENLIRALGSAPTPTVVHVGSSGVNPARIPIDDMASCDADPAVPANRQDPGWSDTFSVHLQQKRRGQNLVVTRTDTDGGWGQDLEITCTANGPLPGLVQLADQCEAIPVTEAIDMIEDLLGHCDTVQLDCSGPSGCRGGPPVQCAQAPGAASGVTTLAEVITIGEEVSYDGLCNQDVDGGGWTYVAEPGLSTVDPDDVFAEELHGYHEFVYDLKGMRFNQVLVRRTSATWCDSWGHSGDFWGVDGLSEVSMGIAMGTEEFCYHNGERGYKFISTPFCTRHTGSAAPDPTSCPGPQGIPYAGNIWSHGDPNTADDGDMCESITIQNICADGTSTCSTGSECTGCNADGSMVLFTLADPDTTADYLEIENFDAWLQEAGGCDGAPTGGAYYLTSACLTWTAARADCQAQGGDLVVIADDNKNTEVTAFMQSFGDYYGSCDGPYPWIGGQNCQGSACEWVDGTAWGFTGPGFAVDDPYLHLYTNGRWGTWDDGHTAFGMLLLLGVVASIFVALIVLQLFARGYLISKLSFVPCSLDYPHSGICERSSGVQYEVFIRDSHMMTSSNGGGGH